MGIYTDAVLLPNLLKERPSQPAVFGAYEPRLNAWVLLQTGNAESYDVEIRRPDNSIFASGTFTIPGKVRYGWHITNWSLPSPLPPEEYGTWVMNALIGGLVTKSVEFQVGATTVFGPRFWPIAGRSFHLDETTTYLDTLRVSSLGGPVTYALKDAPPYVSITQDSIVVIQPPTSHWSRNRYFQALATDGAGLQDTMWYHLVDFLGSTVVAVPSEQRVTPSPDLSVSIAPNPFNPEGVLTIQMARAGPLKVRLFDTTGRAILRLLDEPASPAGIRRVLIGRGGRRSAARFRRLPLSRRNTR